MYGEIYYHTYCIEDTLEQARLSILKRDYTGQPTLVQAGPVPFRKGLLNDSEDSIGGVYPTMAKIQLFGDKNFGMEDLFTADDAEFMVEHYIEDQLDWTGFMTPESFGEEDTCEGRYLDINALDGLTKLKDIKFLNADGLNYGTDDEVYSRTLLFFLKEALLKTDLPLPIKTLVDRQIVLTNIAYQTLELLPLPDGWVYSTAFISNPLIEPGNYVRYRWGGNTSYTVSLIEDVDYSELSGGGGVGILLNPQMQPSGTSSSFDIGFFPVEVLDTEDVLAQAQIDARIWVDPGVEIEPTNKAEAELPYYMFTAGTYSAWDVLDNIARAFDFKISQNRGSWVLEALDKHRMVTQYFDYNSDGVFQGRSDRYPVKTIPVDANQQEDPVAYRLSGNTRFFGKTLKSVGVNYAYRYKVVGDELDNLLLNGGLSRYLPLSAPSTYTPPDWQRMVFKDPITLNVDFLINTTPRFVELSTPHTFNSNNRLRPLPAIRVSRGDKMFLSWVHQVREFLTASPNRFFYTTIVITLSASNGDTYYLVNSGDQPGWTDQQYMSPNPTGKWIKEDGTRIWHFNSNYATSHNPDAAGSFTPPSKVNLTMDSVPEDGTLTIDFVGVAMAYFNEDGRPLAYSYRANGIEDGNIVYVEDQMDLPMNVRFYRGDQNYDVRTRIGAVALGRVTSSEAGGTGRAYSYTQESPYADTLSVGVQIGDEDNVNHMSAVTYQDKVHDLWIDSTGELGVGALGMTLARALMRRYYRPKSNMDGSFVDTLPELNDVVDLYDDGRLFSLRGGEIDVDGREVSGTMEQLSQLEIPYGGVDGGAGSMTSGSSSSSGGGGGSSTGGTPVTQSSNVDLQRATDRGASTTRIMSARGTRNEIVLSVPHQYPGIADQTVGDRYLHTNEGYLFVNDQKAKAGNADNADSLGGVPAGELKLDISAAPTSATAAGEEGSVIITEDFIYVCIAENTWKRTPISTW